MALVCAAKIWFHYIATVRRAKFNMVVTGIYGGCRKAAEAAYKAV
jgi:hypothetical protein